jgi:hypothetical protein
MSEQQNQTTELQRPSTDDRDEWKAYWQAQGIPWHVEPEVDEARQTYLMERRAIVPDFEKGIYPSNLRRGARGLKAGGEAPSPCVLLIGRLCSALGDRIGSICPLQPRHADHKRRSTGCTRLPPSRCGDRSCASAATLSRNAQPQRSTLLPYGAVGRSSRTAPCKRLPRGGSVLLGVPSELLRSSVTRPASPPA